MSSTQKTPTNINNIYVINNNDNEDEKKKEMQRTKLSDEKIKEIVSEYKEALLKEIENILILIYDKNIIEINQFEDDRDKKEKEESNNQLEKSKRQLSKFSRILGSYYNNFIKDSLFIKIFEHINKYKTKIFEIKEIKDMLLMKTYINKRKKVGSPNKELIKNKYNFIRSNSTLNHSSNNLQIALTTLFGYLRNIKRCLIYSTSDIENIFRIPLIEFPDFNIRDVQLFLFNDIFQNDPLISECIERFKDHSDYNIAIREIEYGIESIFGKIIKKKFIFKEDNIKKKIKKKTKKKRKNNINSNNKIKKQNMDNILINNNIVKNEKNEDNKEENDEDKIVNNFKENLEVFNQQPKKKKLKCNVSKKWLNHLFEESKKYKTLN